MTLGIVVILAPLIGLALSLGGELVPDKFVADALVEGISNGSLEENDYSTSRLGHRSDNFTECIALTIGLDDPEGSTPLDTALESRTGGRCTSTVPMLVRYDQNGDLAGGPRFQYWHGYTAITRPMLAMFGLRGMRTAAWALLLVGFGTLGLTLRRRFGWPQATALLAPVALTTDFASLADSSHQAIALAIALAGAAFSIRFSERRRSLQLVAIGSVVGSAMAFFDLLTAPIVSSALTVAVVMFASFEEGFRNLRLFGRGFSVGLGWIIGFTTTWFSKWVLAALVLGYDLVKDNISNQAQFRISGDHPSVSDSLLAATRKNAEYFFDQPFSRTITALACLALLISVVRYVVKTRDMVNPLLLASPALTPVLWYEFMSNHTQIHNWITFRAYAISIGVFAATAVVLERASHHPTPVEGIEPDMDITTDHEPVFDHISSTETAEVTP